MTARTLLVTNRDTGLLRLRMAWFLASLAHDSPGRSPLARVQRGARSASARLWRRVLRRFAPR